MPAKGKQKQKQLQAVGTVRYIGTPAKAPGGAVMLGVQLKKAVGDSSGSYKGTRLFAAAGHNTAHFLRAASKRVLAPVTSSSPSPRPRTASAKLTWNMKEQPAPAKPKLTLRRQAQRQRQRRADDSSTDSRSHSHSASLDADPSDARLSYYADKERELWRHEADHRRLTASGSSSANGAVLDWSEWRATSARGR